MASRRRESEESIIERAFASLYFRALQQKYEESRRSRSSRKRSHNAANYFKQEKKATSALYPEVILVEGSSAEETENNLAKRAMDVEFEESYDVDMTGGDGDSGSSGRWRKSKTPKTTGSKNPQNEVEDVTPSSSSKVAEERVSDSDDDDDDEPEILESSSFKPKLVLRNPLHNTRHPPEFIDLTNEEDISADQPMESDLDDDDDVIVEEEEVHLHNLDGIEDEDDVPQLLEVPPLSKKEMAEERRMLGNNHFKLAEYNQALEAYNQAIGYVPNEASYYGNRAACYMMMKRYQEALSDSQHSLKIDPSYEKSYLRIVRVTLALGDVTACKMAIQQYDRRGITSTDISLEKKKLLDLEKILADVEASTLRKDFRRVLFLCERALEIATGDISLKIRKGYTLVKLGRHMEAAEMAAEVMNVDSHNTDGFVIRGLCHYELDNMEKSLSFFKGALQRSPDAPEPKALYKQVKQIKEHRETATELYKQGKYDESKALYLEGVKLVTGESDLKNTCLEAKFYFNLSLIFNKQRMYEDALQYASKAININQSYFKAFVHRATVHNSKEMYEEAARDYEAALKLDPSKRELRNEIQNAKMSAKRAKRKDYYKILDIPKSATEDDIRKAYKKRALLHHPDRHAGATEAKQKEQEKNFKDVGEAYEVLSDPKKRFRYDQGHDLMDQGNSGGGGAYYDPYDANQLFNMFFSSGGGAGMGHAGHAHGGRGSGPRYYTSGTRGGGHGFR